METYPKDTRTRSNTKATISSNSFRRDKFYSLDCLSKKKKIYDHLRNKIHPIAQDQSERKPPAQPYHTELNPAHKMKHGIARAFDYTDPRPLIRRARNEHATILVRLSIRD